MLEPKFYKAHLERVSRSFAFCIAELEDDLRPKVALAYLLFRVLDTIEDSKWPNPESQKKAFEEFLRLIKDPTISFEELKKLILLSEHKEEENLLIKDSAKLFEAYTKLNQSERQPLQAALQTMTEGMMYFALEKKHQIKDIKSLDSYCYFVAGCIGELLTAWTFKGVDEKTYEESIHFGLFLQKINILKDFQDDDAAGRNFLWSWEEVSQSLRTHADYAYSYIRKIPNNRLDYKLFCAWSFFLGLFSYPTLEESLRSQKRIKLSRLEVWNFLGKLKKLVSNENELDLIFKEYSRHLPEFSYKINTKNLASIT